MTPILPDRLCWSSAIGNFIINFGMLDYLVFEFLESCLPPEEFVAVKREHFQDRIGRIKSHLSGSACPAEWKGRFDKFFDRLDPIRELRNHIAHGHLFVRQNEDTKTLVMTCRCQGISMPPILLNRGIWIFPNWRKRWAVSRN